MEGIMNQNQKKTPTTTSYFNPNPLQNSRNSANIKLKSKPELCKQVPPPKLPVTQYI